MHIFSAFKAFPSISKRPFFLIPSSLSNIDSTFLSQLQFKQMASSETHHQPSQHDLNYKTTVLKVSIHCQGCKRKINKILQGIHGVNNIEIDLRQQKVTVMGNVNSDVLLMKLNKTGKHAELWPEPTTDLKKKHRKPENKEKQSDTETENSEEIEETTKTSINDNETGKVKVVVDTSKSVEVNGNNRKEGRVTGKTGEVHVQEVKPEERKQTKVLPAETVTQKKVSVAVQFPNDENEEAEKIGGESVNGGGKKKKKKGKEKVINNNGNESVLEFEQCGGSGNRSNGYNHGQSQSNFHGGSVPVLNVANESMPRHQSYPPQYYGPSLAAAAAPVCTVSHHTAYPSSSSYGAAYYAPQTPYQYAHVVNSGNEMEHTARPYTYDSESYTYMPSQPSDSFVYFSDENPNACSVM